MDITFITPEVSQTLAASIAGTTIGNLGSDGMKSLMAYIRSFGTFARENTEKLEMEKDKNIKAMNLPLLDDPPMHIIAPLIVANAFITSEQLRFLYGKLLSKAHVVGYEKDVHPAFIEIIKQLSPDEAMFISSTNILKGVTPSCSIRSQKAGMPCPFTDTSLLHQQHLLRVKGNGTTYIHNYIMTNSNKSPEEIDTMLENLERLHLIRCSSSHLLEPHYYSKFCNDDYMKKISTALLTLNGADYEFVHIPRYIEATRFGEKFRKVCID